MTFPLIAKLRTESGGNEVATAVSTVIVAISVAGITKESAGT